MAPDISRRRWVGGIALLLAAGMLVCGETLLKGKLAPTTFLLYWMACMGLTALAIIIAVRDLRVQRDRARAERRELLESTFKDIQEKARAKARNASKNAGQRNPSDRE